MFYFIAIENFYDDLNIPAYASQDSEANIIPISFLLKLYIFQTFKSVFVLKCYLFLEDVLSKSNELFTYLLQLSDISMHIVNKSELEIFRIH